MHGAVALPWFELMIYRSLLTTVLTVKVYSSCPPTGTMKDRNSGCMGRQRVTLHVLSVMGSSHGVGGG